jgi:hypothetical protein
MRSTRRRKKSSLSQTFQTFQHDLGPGPFRKVHGHYLHINFEGILESFKRLGKIRAFNCEVFAVNLSEDQNRTASNSDQGALHIQLERLEQGFPGHFVN